MFLDQALPQTALTVPLCVPVADFTTASTQTCVGSMVSFRDASWNAVIDSYAWEFEDGSPATSTSANPTSIFYYSGGYKTVTLTCN